MRQGDILLQNFSEMLKQNLQNSNMSFSSSPKEQCGTTSLTPRKRTSTHNESNGESEMVEVSIKTKDS
jgi:hypothetical protein